MTNNLNGNGDESRALQARRKSLELEFVIIGRVTKPHGLRGEICIFPITDDPERFGLLKSVFVGDGENRRVSANVERAKVRSHDVIVKLEGVDSRDQAEELRGSFFEIRREDCLPLEEGAHYIFELIGMEVKTLDGQSIGRIKDVIDYPANDVYVVKSDRREVLIPVIQDVVKSVDVTQGVVIIDPIEGLLD